MRDVILGGPKTWLLLVLGMGSVLLAYWYRPNASSSWLARWTFRVLLVVGIVADLILLYRLTTHAR